MHFGIRRAIAADWPNIRRVHKRAVIHEVRFANEAERPTFAQLERAFRGELWLAEAGGRTLGFIACSGNDISWLYVDPAYFRRGIGRALLRHAISHCGAIAHVDVLATNAACLELMMSEGFIMAERETITIPGYGQAPVQKLRRVSLP